MANSHIIIVTGMSGSGKSTTLRALEDAGFFCIDNLPVALLTKLLDLKSEFGRGPMRLALVMDLREKDFTQRFPEQYNTLKSRGAEVEMVFLDASDEILIERFSHTKRQHPITSTDSIPEKIKIEREFLAPVKALADRVLDTSHYNIHELREVITQAHAPQAAPERMNIQILAFGYKHGVPHEADLVIDVRFLPNPFYITHLRDKDGRDQDVSDYVLERPEAKEFLRRYTGLLDMLIPLYRKEGKSYLTLAVGCTGGRHRSVAVARALDEELKKLGIHATLRYRDVDRE